MSTFFVTGGAGFLGTPLVDRLRADGHLVYVLDKVFGEDLKHGPRVNDFVARVQPDWMIHMAATPGVSTDIGVMQDNIFQTVNVLNAMHHYAGCKRILFISTGSVYGQQPPNAMPTKEDAPMQPQVSFYAAGKLACEGMISAEIGRKQHIDTGVVLRLGTIIGPGNNKGFIKDFVRKLKQDPTKLEVLGDGLQTKSYLHVNDFVEAVIAAVNHGNYRRGFHTFNVSHDYWASIRELAPVVVDEMLRLGHKCAPDIKFGDSQAGFFGDIPRIELENWKLKRETGWQPEISIENAVRENVEWLLKHPEVFG